MHYEGKLATDWVLKNVRNNQSNLIRGRLGRSRDWAQRPVLKPPMKVNSTLCGMEQAATRSLEEARKVVEAAIAAGKISTSSMPRNDGMAQGAVRPRGVGSAIGRRESRLLVLTLTVLPSGTCKYKLLFADMQCNPRQGQIDQWIKSGKFPRHRLSGRNNLRHGHDRR